MFFLSVKHLPLTRPIYRLNISLYEADLSVKHLPLTYSKEQIVCTYKYVQAVGLLILGSLDGRKRLALATDGGADARMNHRPRDFPQAIA